MLPSQTDQPSFELPPISIRLILIWTALSALGISVWRWQYASIYAEISSSPDFDPSMRSYFAISQVIACLGAAITAAQLTGLGVLAGVWRKTRRLLWNPGHWLMLIACVGVIPPIIAPIVANIDQFLTEQYNWTRFGWQAKKLFANAAFVTLGIYLPLVMNLYAGVRHRGVWRAAFFLAISPFVFAAAVRSLSFLQLTVPMPWSLTLSHLSHVVPTVFLAYAATTDFNKQVSRDWVHWVGVGCAIATGLQFLLYAIGSIWTMP